MPPIGTTQMCGEAGTGAPGAPRMTYCLLIAASTNNVTGHVVVTQAVQGSNSDIPVMVTGKLRYSLPPLGTVITLEGTYVYTLPPPAIGSFREEFTAALFLSEKGDGQGNFTYGGHDVGNVPVKRQDCKQEPPKKVAASSQS
jgi:hypothetical protein